MRTVPFTLKLESEESQFKAGRYNASQVIVFKDGRKIREEIIKAGRSDDVYLFERAGDFIVLCTNRRYGYLGMEILGGSEVFLQGYFEIKEIFEKKDPFNYSPMYLTKILYNLLD